ncbi:MAG: ATP-binding cassette domain-containing protein, partial [Cyanobacteria bacterium P01_C01_bin.70]
MLSSILSGVSSAGIIATINQAIAQLPTVQTGLFGVFATFCLSLWLCQFLSWILIVRLSQKVIRNLRIDISERLLNCPLQHLEYLGQPKLLATLLEDINTISEASTNLALLFVNVAILVGVCIYLCWLSPSVFAIILLFIVLGFTLYNLMQRPGIKSFRLARQVSDILFGHFRSVTEGTKELQLNRQRRQAFLEADLKASANQAMRYWIKGITAFAFAGSSGIIMVFIPVGWLVFFLAQSNAAAAALVPSYVLAILYLFTPLGDIINALPAIARASIALEKVESLGLSLLENSIALSSSLKASPKPAFSQDWQRIKLTDIQHAYRGANEAHVFEIKGINLTLEHGEIMFLVGGNGSGKSTLAKLITGLYIPDDGRISVDDGVVNDQNREEYRQLFSAIFQDFYLFEQFLGIHPHQLQDVNRYLDAL